MSRQRHLILLGLILLLAWGLRLYGLDRLSLWVDEGYSVAISSLSPGDIVVGTANAQHPPFYYLLLHYWMKIAGNSVYAVRLLSALAGWATVALVYFLGRRFAPGIGLVAAGLLAVSPAHIWYSQEARMYSLLALLGVLSTWLAWTWWQDESGRARPRSLLYVAFTLAALYTHNFALFIIAAQNLAALILGWPQIRRHPRLAFHWLALQGAILAGFAPWLPVLIFQASHHEMTWIAPVSWPAVRNTWLYLLSGATWQGRWFDLVGAVLGLGLVALALWPRRAGNTEGRSDLGWAALWFWGTSLSIVAVSRRLLIYQDKQLLIVLPPLVLLLALGLSRLRFRAAQGAAMLVLLALLAGPLHWQYTQAQKQDWQALAGHVDAHARPGDLVYFSIHAGSLTFNYYLTSDLPQAGFPPDYDLVQGGWVGEIARPEVVDAQLEALSSTHPRIWLIEFSPGFWDPQGLILDWLNRHYHQADTLESRDIDLRLFVRGQ